MPVSAEILRELHRLHRQLTDLRDRSDRGPKQLKAREANLARLAEELTKVQAESKAARMRADQKQLQLKSSEEKITGYRAKLNACSTNREYQALKEQIAADEMACSVLSDEILEGLEKIEDYQRLVGEAQQRITSAKADLTKAQDTVRQQNDQLASEIARLEGELAAVEERLPPDFRSAYDRLVKSKGEDAMAEVQDRCCGGCYQQLTQSLLAVLSTGKGVVCKTCGRFIYFSESRTP